jgi:hypothetical protein
MANILYGKHRQRLQTAGFNWNTANIKMAFVAVDYVPDGDVDEFLTDLPTDSILARSGVLSGKTATSGFAAGLTPAFLLYRNDRPVVGVLLFEDTGVDATSKLICYSDDGPALPFVGVGFNYAVSYNAVDGGFYRA